MHAIFINMDSVFLDSTTTFEKVDTLIVIVFCRIIFNYYNLIVFMYDTQFL